MIYEESTWPNGNIKRTLSPELGMFLHRKGEEIYSADTIFLGKNDSTDKWEDVAEIPPEPEPDAPAEEQDYVDALNELGVKVDG